MSKKKHFKLENNRIKLVFKELHEASVGSGHLCTPGCHSQDP